MSEIQIGFMAVFGHIAFAVLIRIEGTRVNIDIGVKLLNRNSVATCLEQTGQRSRDDSFAKG